jgi:hypothetical protein
MLTGDGVPDPGLGTDGDIYFDNDTGDLYTKDAGTWTATGDNIYGTIPADIAADAAAADAARIAAETARDAAMTEVGIYPTTAAGLAAAPEAGYFFVTGALPTDPMSLYQDIGGVATLRATYPSGSSIASLSVTPTPPTIWGLLDQYDNAALTLLGDGTVNVGKASITTLNGLPVAEAFRRLHRTVNLRSSIAHWISYGQSLSLGQAATLNSFPGTFYDSVMFNANGVASAGPRAQEGSGTVAQNHASLVAFEERPLSGTAPLGNIETPLGGVIHMIKGLLVEENQIAPADAEYVILGSAPGLSNTPIDGLDKPSAPYTKVMDDVTYGLSLSQAAGKSYAVDAVLWSQGEADINLATTRAAYLAKFQALYTDLNTDIRAVTGQAHDIKVIAYACTTYDQTNADIALAQIDAAVANPNILIATAIYAVEHLDPSNAHLPGIGSAALGAYFGYCGKRTVIDGATWPLFIPSRITRQGTILDVEFPDTSFPLAISDYLFPTQANAGLTAVDGASANNPITSVAVVGKRRLRVVLTSAVAGKLRYCYAAPAWGGNLHNLNTTDIKAARRRYLYQPVLPFEVSFS